MYERKYWSMPTSEVLHELDSSEKGLSKKLASERLAVYGANEIGKREIRTGLFIFLSQFKNPLVVILIGASIVAAFLGELTDAMIIIVIVIINGLLGFYQEYRSEKALERLGKYIKFTAKVIRDGEKQQIDTKELVLGDIVLLGTGDIVPGDMRLLTLDELSIDESSLTGESYPQVREEPSLHGSVCQRWRRHRRNYRYWQGHLSRENRAAIEENQKRK